MSEILDQINGVEVILRGNIDDIYKLFGNLRSGSASPAYVPPAPISLPVEVGANTDMMNILSKLVADSTDGDGLNDTDDIVTGLKNGVYTKDDVGGVFNFLSQNSGLVNKYATGKFDKTDIATIAIQLLGTQTNPLLTSLVGLVINKITNKKKKISKVPPMISVVEPPEVSDTLNDFDLTGLRSNRVHEGNLRKSGINITILNKNVKSLLWELPSGFKSGDHGFMFLGFDSNKKFISGSEEHWSHGSADGRMLKEYPNIKYYMIVWTTLEGRGDWVGGRSDIHPV